VLFYEKRDLIDYLIESGAIDFVLAAPPTCSYTLSQLQAMSVKQLKACMNDQAGVFFNASDVVEKQDMVHIFVNSGRVEVLPEENCAVEEQDEDHPQQQNGDVAVTDEVIDYDDLDGKPAAINRTNCNNSNNIVLVETVDEHSDDDMNECLDDDKDTVDGRTETSLVMEEDAQFCEPTQNKSGATTTAHVSVAVAPNPGVRVMSFSSSSSSSSLGVSNDNNVPASPPFGVSRSSLMDSTTSLHHKRVRCSIKANDCVAIPPTPTPTCLPNDNDVLFEQHETQLLHHSSDASSSVLQLPLSGAISVDRSGLADQSEGFAGATTDHSAAAAAVSDPLYEWGVSEIRALADLYEVDLSDCRNRGEMIHVLSSSAVLEQRPHVGHYFETLAPLARLTVPQLRAVAREQRINVSDCLEKGDIIQRLVRHAGRITGN
jgi:hypothetical protein